MGKTEAPDRLFDESTLVGTVHVVGRLSVDLGSTLDPPNNIGLFGEEILNICGCVPIYPEEIKDGRTIGDYLGIKFQRKHRSSPSPSVGEEEEDTYTSQESEDIESHNRVATSSEPENVELVEFALYSNIPEKPYKGLDILTPSEFLEGIYKLGQNIKPAQKDKKSEAPTRDSLGASLKEIVNTMVEATELIEAAKRVRKDTSKENELRRKSADLYASSRSALSKLIYLDELMRSGHIDKDAAENIMLYFYNVCLLREFGLRMGDFARLNVAEKRKARERLKNKYFDKISGYLTSGSWITKDKQ